jgi:hypothetical protein
LSPSARIALTPEHVAVSSGGSYRESPVGAGNGEALLKALTGLLEGQPLRGHAEIVLSHQLAPVWLLPPSPVRLGWKETEGWVRERLAEQFGELAGKWRLAWEMAPPGEPILASAVETEWLEQLAAVLQAKAVKPRRVQPWLAATCNGKRRPLGSGSAWLALAERGRLTLAGLEGGRLRTLRSGLVTGEPAAALAGMLEREALLGTGVDSKRLWLQALHVEADWRRLQGLEVRELSPASAGLAAMLGA